MINISGSCNELIKKDIADKVVNYFNSLEGIYGDIYLGYPIYSLEYTNQQLLCDIAIISNVGVYIINILDKEIIDYGKIQDDLYIKVEAKLKKCNFLLNKRKLPFVINVISYAIANITEVEEYPLFNDFEDLKKYFEDFSEAISINTVDLISSAIQEAYGLSKKSEHPNAIGGTKANLINNMNLIVEKYDCNQMNAIMEDPMGIQRIRGMAGSGKTVVLARKAAEIHTVHPEWTIVVTYYTRTLRNQLYNLIDKFYMMRNDGKHPDYSKLRIMHAWGSSSSDGVYYDICKNLQIKSYSYYEAKREYPFSSRPFDDLCGEILESKVNFCKLYDCILIDEAQDFNSSFLKLCCNVLGPEKRLVYAYDELQKLNELSMESPEKIFGFNISKDTPLVTCYRNQANIIVSAHALGMGLYRAGGMIQIPSSLEVWKSIGYKSDEEIIEGNEATLYRDKSTSPDFLNADSDDLIKIEMLNDSNEVYEKLLDSIKENIEVDGLNSEDIIIIDLDGIDSSNHYAALKVLLNLKKDVYDMINIHQAGSSNPEDFFRKDSIVYSSIYRAKGNESYFVYILNAQKCVETLSRTKDRNAIFTAITRSKGWVRVFGYGDSMQELCNEFEKIKQHQYKLYFEIYPTEEDREKMVLLNKDISKTDSEAISNTKKFIDENQDDMGIVLKELFGNDYKKRLREFVVDEENRQ